MSGLGDEDEDDDDEGFGDFEGASKSLGKGKGDDDDEFDPESLEFGFDRADFEGLRQAIWSSGQEVTDGVATTSEATKMAAGVSVETSAAAEGDEGELDDTEVLKLERMMRKLQAVRDISAGLSEEQRKRMAARAVGEVMKEL